MKRAFCIALCLILLGACRPAETGGKQPEQTGEPVPSEALPPETVPLPAEVGPSIGLRPMDAAFNSSFAGSYSKSFRRDFIYSSDDGCYYISLPGEVYPSEMWAVGAYPWDPPEIERFCKIDAQTREVTVLSDRPVSNLVYSEGYVYFYDRSGGGRIKRIKGDAVEEVFSLREDLPDDPARRYKSFFVEGEFLYLLFEEIHTSVWVFSLETRAELPSLRYNASSNAIQIYNGTICSLSADGLEWREGAGERKQDVTAADLIRQFYEEETFPFIESFLYDGVLLAHANRDLLLIRPDIDTLELIARDVYGYAVHNAKIYYSSGDTLYEYDIASKKTVAIVSYYEGIGGDKDDYFGFENIVGITFVHDRCFLYMTGMISYGPARIAGLDLEDKTAVYLTDWFRPRTNRMTSSALGVFSYEYPNDYCVFNDYGSGGGTLFHNYEKRIRVQINSIGYYMGERAITDIEQASRTLTKQGITLYYSYAEDGEAPLAAMIKNGETYINITVVGDPAAIRDNADELFDILKSIHIYSA